MKSIITAIAVLIVGVIILFVYKAGQPTVSPTPMATVTASVSPMASASASPSLSPSPLISVGINIGTKTIVTYTDTGYSPKTVTIKAGQSVTFVNNSSHTMWTASGVHPTHTVYSGTSLSQHCPDTANTSFDECQAVNPGISWTFTFKKVGTWSYHNHRQASDTGTVIVQ